MGSLTYRHNFTGETGYVIAVPKKTTAPLADVICIIDGVAAQTRKAYTAPHSEVSLLIEGLDNVWYTLKFYRSSDGTTLDEEILTLAGNALRDSVYDTTRYEYVVNRGYTNLSPVNTGVQVWADPVTSDKGIRDGRLLNQVYFVNRRGVGDLLTAEITDRSDAGGGWDFADTSTTMEDAEVFFVTVVNRVDAPPVSGSGSTDYNNVVTLTADLNFDPSLHNARVLISNWSASIGKLTMPNLSLLPDCKFKLTTHGGTQSFVGIQFDVGDTVKFRKQNFNVLWLGSAEEIEIIIKSNIAYVAFYSGDYDKVGQRIWGDVVGGVTPELNVLKRDGTQFSQSAQPRLMQWIDTYAVATVTETQWASSTNVTLPDGTTIAVFPYKRFFARDDVSSPKKIRVPNDLGMFMRALSVATGDVSRETQGPGSYQHDSVGPYIDTQGAHGNVDTSPLDTYTGGVFHFKKKLQQNAGESRGKNTGMWPLLKV